MQELRYEVEVLQQIYEGVSTGCDQAHFEMPKVMSNSECQISRMSSVAKLVICIWLVIHTSYKFSQSFQVGVVSHAQSNSK